MNSSIKTSILPNPNSLYWDIDWSPKAVFINTPSVYKQISPNPFPKFPIPKRHQPRWASTIWEIGKLGNGWRYRFPNSQFPKRSQPIWLSTIWEIGKWLQVHTSQFPKSQKTPAQMAQHDLGNWEMVTGTYFPISPKDTSPDGPARFGKLGNWEMAGGTDFPISQFPKRSQPIWLSTIWEIGKWLQVHTSQFPQKTPAQMGQHDSGNWEIGKPKP